MENLIPVVIILGVMGFVAWKNKDKILAVADKFKDRGQAVPKPAVSEVKPEVVTPQEPVPYKVEPKPLDIPNPTVTEKLFGQGIKDRAATLQPTKLEGDYFGQFPTNFPGSLLLGTGYGHAGKFKQAIVTVGLNPISFAIAVPEVYEGSVYFDLTPFPGDSNGDASCTFIIKTWEGNVIVNKEGRLDQVKVMLGKGRGAVKVSRGTYLATVRASKDCKTIFSVTES